MSVDGGKTIRVQLMDRDRDCRRACGGGCYYIDIMRMQSIEHARHLRVGIPSAIGNRCDNFIERMNADHQCMACSNWVRKRVVRGGIVFGVGRSALHQLKIRDARYVGGDGDTES